MHTQISNGVKKIRRILPTTYYKLLALLFLLLPRFTLAFTNSAGDTAGSGSSGQTSGDITIQNPLTANSIPEVLDAIINFLLTLAAPIAVIMTIFAGYLFLVAGDNQEKVKTARKTLLYVVIGVAILILSKGVVSLAKSFLPLAP